MTNYQKIKNELSDAEKQVLYIYYIAETYLYNETIARISKKDQDEIDIAIEKLLRKKLIK